MAWRLSAGAAEPGERMAAWLRPMTAKALAAEFSVDWRTAERWRAGQLPAFGHFARMVDRWGVAFVSYVFEPSLLADRDVALNARLERIAAELATVQEDIRANHTDDGRGAGALAGATAAGLRTQNDGAGAHAGAPGRPVASPRPAPRSRRLIPMVMAVLAVVGAAGLGDELRVPRAPRPARPPVTRTVRGGAARAGRDGLVEV